MQNIVVNDTPLSSGCRQGRGEEAEQRHLDQASLVLLTFKIKVFCRLQCQMIQRICSFCIYMMQVKFSKQMSSKSLLNLLLRAQGSRSLDVMGYVATGETLPQKPTQACSTQPQLTHMVISFAGTVMCIV